VIATQLGLPKEALESLASKSATVVDASETASEAGADAGDEEGSFLVLTLNGS